MRNEYTILEGRFDFGEVTLGRRTFNINIKKYGVRV
jgi:hypothetical protein